MTEYTFDPKSLLKNGKRWFPVMGEIHYSRYPKEYWKEALLKMKEGGVDIVSSYVIWIHHEEIENEFDWTGCRDLRSFVQTIKECGMSMVLRIGPWSHAEVRNGGFPDWLLAKCPEARATNDDLYFNEVKKFYAQTFEQVKDLMLKDNGPIIGVQIENEFGHCGGLWGEEGELHMKKLTALAKEVGFDVPLWTATGWGGAVTGGLLPVMGGYCDAPWDPRPEEIEPSGNFVFSYERNDHAIGSDFGLGENITFDMNKFPYLTAELGGGLQPANKRRPVADPKDIGGMSFTKMGSGCNLLGYYMYHGGVNPEGKLTTLEENKASGSLNDMSIKNYDFRAPLGEYGEPNGSYDEIKLLSHFVHSFGEEIASTDTFIPDSNPSKPDNSTDLRTSWRENKNSSGYVFVNNYQRHQKMAEHLSVELSRNNVHFPKIDVKDGDFFFLPYNMKVGNAQLKYSLATPMCRLNKDYVFYSAVRPAGKEMLKTSCVNAIKDCGSLYDFEGDDQVKIVTLTREEALKSHKISCGDKEYLFITDAVLWAENENGKTKLNWTSTKEIKFKTYPKLSSTGSEIEFEGEENGFFLYKINREIPKAPAVQWSEKGIVNGNKEYEVIVPSYDCHDLFLKINFAGDEAILFENEKRIDDSFYVGKEYPWFIAMRRYGKNEHKWNVQIKPLKKDEKIYYEHPQHFEEEIVQSIYNITAESVIKVQTVVE